MSEQPLRITYETRTIEDQSRDAGARIFRSLQTEGKLDGLDSMSLALLQAMCFVYGRIEEYGGGLSSFVVKDKSIKKIAVELGWSETSAYVPAKQLRKREIIKANSRPPEADWYHFIAGIPEQGVADSARAISDAPRNSDTPGVHKPFREPNIARAISDAPRNSDTPDLDETAFSERPPETAQGVSRNSDALFINTTTNAVVGDDSGRGDGGNFEEKERADVANELAEIGIFGNLIPSLSQKTSLWLAIAVRFEVAGKPTPGRLARWILNQEQPESCINPPAKAKATAELKKRSALTRSSVGTGGGMPATAAAPAPVIVNMHAFRARLQLRLQPKEVRHV